MDPPDDPVEPPPPPPIEVIDLPGYKSYFREVVSPTDRGMLAAAVFFDLIPSDYFASFGSDIPAFPIAIVTEDGVKFRHQIPTTFEPALFQLVGEQSR